MKSTVQRVLAAVVSGLVAGSLLATAPALAADTDPTQPNRVPSANTAPATVWRVDSRPPGTIFTYGFPESGEDDNLLASVNNATNERAYVPTTTNPMFFHDFAYGAAQTNYIWVYEIRATANFYNATGSIEWLRDNTNAPQRIRTVARDTYDAFRNQQEWSALGGIPREQVIRGGRLQLSVLEANPNRNPVDLVDRWFYFGGYESASTRANAYLVTNPAFNGINEPNRDYGCEPSRVRDRVNDQCRLGGFRLDPLPDPYDGKKFAFRPKLAYNTAVDMNSSVQMYNAHEGAPQVFTPEGAPGLSGYYRLKNAQTGKFLTFTETGYGAATTRTLVGADSNGNPERMFWKFERQSDGWFLIVSRNGEKLISRNLNGGLTVINSTGSPRDQDKWNIALIGGIPMTNDRIAPVQSTTVLGAGTGGSGVPGGSAVTLRTPFNNPGSEQRWFYQYNANAGAYLIGNVKSTTAPGVYLVIARRSTATPPTAVEMWGGGYSDQYWIIRQNPSGFYEFLNYDMAKSADGANATVFALDLPAPSAGLGAAVGAHPYQGGTSQQWRTCSMAQYNSTSCQP